MASFPLPSPRPPPPPIQDLKVRIHGSSLVFPCQETEKRSIFLSNIDKVLNFNVETVHFFPANKDFPFAAVAKRVRTALSEVLVPYDFLAGRLKCNPVTGRLEIDCNAAGAGFVVASTDYSLDDVGDLVYPNPAFTQLIVTSLDLSEPGDQPLFILQLTSFKCGGFAMAISNNHATFDGLSFKTFLDNLAALAADKPLPVPPCNDRRLLAARSPPRVTFPHPELVKLPVQPPPDSTPTVFESTPEDLDFKIFRLTSGDISDLKARATSDDRPTSGFNAVAALVWRCKALSAGGGDMDRESTMLYAIDLRPRLEPPLPTAYAGNAVVSAYARAACREMAEGPWGKIVEKVKEGARRITDEYARSVIDWGEMHAGFPGGEFLVSSWWRLGFADVVYPWGRPRYSCPVVYRRKDIILLFPDMGDSSGVNVLVALPQNEMDKFQRLFHAFLALK